MQVVIQFTEAEEREALPILLRRSYGRILPERRYVIDERLAARLREHGILFHIFDEVDDGT